MTAWANNDVERPPLKPRKPFGLEKESNGRTYRERKRNRQEREKENLTSIGWLAHYLGTETPRAGIDDISLDAARWK